MNEDFLSEKKIGLALGGGAALGGAHLGVLRALKEHGIEAEFITGTSVGALVAAMYAFGVPLEKMEALARKLNWLDIAGLSPSRYALLTNKKMTKLLEDEIGKVTFEEAPLPLAMLATDISNGQKVVLQSGSIQEATMASTCIPGVFNPVTIEGRMLVDGGIVENVPVSPLRPMGAQTIIAVDLQSGTTHAQPDHIVDVMMNSFYFLLNSLSSLQNQEADVVIKPDLSDFSMARMNKMDDLMEAGYQEAQKVLTKLKARK